jgi:two-component system sensor histidine kinase UhpB
LCELVGYEDDELQELTFQDITHPDDLDADLAHVQDLIDGKRETYQMENFTKQCAVIWVLLSVSIARDEAARPCTSSPRSRTSPSASGSRSTCIGSPTTTR